MVAKELLLEGYGKIFIQPINIKEKDYETVDPTGNPVTRKTIGARARTVYETSDGSELSSSHLCKKIPFDGEELIVPKFNVTKEVTKENIEENDENGIIYRALNRKFYNVATENEKIKELVINQNKSLKFPFAAGLGWNLWNAVLTNWNGKLLMVACQGDLQKELDKYSEDTVELEIEIIPQQKNMKKLVMAMAMV